MCRAFMCRKPIAGFSVFYFRRAYSSSGQSLAELAIFGALFLMLVALLVNYGMRYNFNHRFAQKAFIKAYRAADDWTSSNKPIATTYMLVDDRHIPDASSRFGVGSVNPFVSSATVTRSYLMHQTPDNGNELSVIAIDIKGRNEPCLGGTKYSKEKHGGAPYVPDSDKGELGCYYTTAGIREETLQGDLEQRKRRMEKYKMIFGDGNVWWVNENNKRDIKIIDNSAGEIVDYATTVLQCRQIVDPRVCRKECNRSKVPYDDSEIDCESICNRRMNPPNQADSSNSGGAWYCADYTETDSSRDRYEFPRLDAMFAGLGPSQAMGLQQDYNQTTRMDNTMNKTESTGSISTTDDLDWNVTTRRTLQRMQYGTDTGEIVTEAINTTVGQEDENTQWQTDK